MLAEHGTAQTRTEANFDRRRNESMLKKVQEAGVQRDFVSRLSHSSHAEVPQMRELAMAKLRSHPDLRGALAAVPRLDSAARL